MVLGADLETLPPPPPEALPLLLGALLALWLTLRVWILRGQLRSRAAGEPAPDTWSPLLALARSPLALPVLLLVVAALGVGAVLAWR